MNCPNCNTQIVEKDKFCSSCGQKNKTEDEFSFKSIISEFLSSSFSVDGRLFRTLKALFIPGQFYKDYIEGKRARYMHPIKLFVFLNIFLLGLLYSINSTENYTTNSSSNSDIVTDLNADSLIIDSVDLANLSVDELSKKYGGETALERHFYKQFVRFQKDKQSFRKYVNEKLPWSFVLFIPIMALFGFLIEWKKKIAYFQHILFWTNLVSSFLIVQVLFNVFSPWIHKSFEVIPYIFYCVFVPLSIRNVFPRKSKFLLHFINTLYLLISLTVLLFSTLAAMLIAFMLF